MEISLQLQPVWWDEPPKIKIYFDDDLLWHGSIDRPVHHSFSIDTDGRTDSEFSIELFDKNITQTVVEHDDIIKDQLLTIESMVIDDISLDYLLFSAAEYWPHYPEHLIAESQRTGQQLSPVLKKVTTLGFNGTWKLRFTYPFEIWYLENLP